MSAAEQQLEKPKTFNGDLANLPKELDELKALKPRWILWRWLLKGSKWTKPPYNKDGVKVDPRDTEHWLSYDDVIALYQQGGFDGIGFVLVQTDVAPFDLDNCRDEHGFIKDWAQELIRRADSYVEGTPSGTGIRIITKTSRTEAEKSRKQAVGDGSSCETYRNSVRFITITGNVIPPARPITNGDALIDQVRAELDQRQLQEPSALKAASELDELIKKGAQQGEDRSAKLWWVICELIRAGYDREQLLTTILDKANGISAHIYDQSGRTPREYAEKQVDEAFDKIDLVRDDKGTGLPTQDNVRVACVKLGISVRYDEFSDRVLVKGLEGFGPALDDAGVNRLWLLMDKRLRFGPAKGFLRAVLGDWARQRGFHPVRDYLDALAWDGEPRLDTWLVTYGGAENTEYARAVGSITLIAAVRRVREPGCLFQEMLTLESPTQGKMKSTAIEVMAVHQDWFDDNLPLSANPQRVIEQTRGRWIIEAAELSGMRKADVESLKAFLSRRVDRSRMAFGHMLTEAPRQFIVVGTTNSQKYLKDGTGNRRFWPIRVDKFDVEALKRDRDQIWAEAAHREAQGECVRLDPKLWDAAANEQAERHVVDPMFEDLAEQLGDMEGKISVEDVWTIVGFDGNRAGFKTQAHMQRCAEAMIALGWHRPENEKGRLRIRGKPRTAWVKGSEPHKEIMVRRSDDGHVCTEYA